MQTLQIEAHKYDNNAILRAAGVKRIHPGWYSVCYRGVSLDRSSVCGASRNPRGVLTYPRNQ